VILLALLGALLCALRAMAKQPDTACATCAKQLLDRCQQHASLSPPRAVVQDLRAPGMSNSPRRALSAPAVSRARK